MANPRAARAVALAAVAAAALLAAMITLAPAGAAPTPPAITSAGASASTTSTPATTTPATTTPATTTTTSRTAEARATRTRPSRPTPTMASATIPVPTVPVPTMAPISTHDARVGTGVLVPEVVAEPRRVAVASIGLDAAVTPTGADERGELAIPDTADELVWWRYGATPGAPGSAVIAGHVDWRGELGAFDRLHQVPVGAPVEVTFEDGRVATFVVTTVTLVDKAAVAVDGTFARTGDPVLRLVTCGGDYDAAARRYRANVVVTAVPG